MMRNWNIVTNLKQSLVFGSNRPLGVTIIMLQQSSNVTPPYCWNQSCDRTDVQSYAKKKQEEWAARYVRSQPWRFKWILRRKSAVELSINRSWKRNPNKLEDMKCVPQFPVIPACSKKNQKNRLIRVIFSYLQNMVYLWALQLDNAIQAYHFHWPILEYVVADP